VNPNSQIAKPDPIKLAEKPKQYTAHAAITGIPEIDDWGACPK